MQICLGPVTNYKSHKAASVFVVVAVVCYCLVFVVLFCLFAFSLATLRIPGIFSKSLNISRSEGQGPQAVSARTTWRTAGCNYTF